MKFKLSLLILIVSLMFIGCAEIKPMTLPEYYAPDLSHITRPDVPLPVEGKDYTVNDTTGTVTYNTYGQDLLAAEAMSEKAGWVQVESLKQIVQTQTEMIKQKDQLIVMVDLKRQYSEKQTTMAKIEKYASWVIEVILIGLLIAK